MRCSLWSLSKIEQKSDKIKVSKSIPQKPLKFSILEAFWPPKVVPKLTQNQRNSIKTRYEAVILGLKTDERTISILQTTKIHDRKKLVSNQYKICIRNFHGWKNNISVAASILQHILCLLLQRAVSRCHAYKKYWGCKDIITLTSHNKLKQKKRIF